jgi:phage terminase small subunit
MAHEPDPRPTAPLTAAQQRFVDAYIATPNAVRAYRAAYPNTSYRSAAVQAHWLLKKPNIRAEIEAGRRAQQRRTRLSADRVLRELARVAFADVGELFDPDGRLREPHRVPLETRRALASVKVTRERVTRRVTRDGETTTTETVHESVVEYRFASKMDALGRLCDCLGLSASLPPLQVVLSLLPPPLAVRVRQCMAEMVPQSG